MIELFVALLIAQSETPSIAECRVEAETDNGRRSSRILELSADCGETPAPGLQEAADAALALVGIDDRFRGGTGVAPALQLERRQNGEWAPLPGQLVMYRHLQIPVTIVERGYRHLSCAYAGFPDEIGRLVDLQTYCLVDGQDRPGRLVRMAQHDLEETLEDARLIPVDVRYCFSDEVRITAAVIDVSGGFSNPEPVSEEPDIGLPNLCLDAIE